MTLPNVPVFRLPVFVLHAACPTVSSVSEKFNGVSAAIVSSLKTQPEKRK